MATKRILLLGIPIDILEPEDVAHKLLDLTKKPGTKQIVFLSIWDFMRARSNTKFKECIRNADLILPTSRSILRGAQWLGMESPFRYNPFPTIISFLSALDNSYKTLYLFGGRKKPLAQAERNVRATFRNIHLVGRYVGHYPKSIEKDIISAMYKASPSLVLIGDGITERDCWAFNRRNSFSSSIFVYHKDIINIFAKRAKPIPEKRFEKGLEILTEILYNPLKIFLILPYIWYNILLVWYKFAKTS